jgi:hypothetical protein
VATFPSPKRSLPPPAYPEHVRKLVLAFTPALSLIGLPATPADARVEPVVLTRPAPTPEACVVPASDLRFHCGPLRSPDRLHAAACNMPAVYLGGRPGPCPAPEGPPQSLVIPIRTPDLIR